MFIVKRRLEVFFVKKFGLNKLGGFMKVCVKHRLECSVKVCSRKLYKTVLVKL